MKELGERLRAIVDFVDPGSKVADVGCDHAYVSIELAKEKNCTCIAMDIKEGPLKTAEENIREAAGAGKTAVSGIKTETMETAKEKEAEEESAEEKKAEEKTDKEEADKEEADKIEADKEEADKIEADKEEADKEEADKEKTEEAKVTKIEEMITTRLSDGLAELAVGEVDTIVIAGMGGHLILDILKNGASKIRPGMKLVLSPQSDLRLVRYELRKMNIFIEKERCLEDSGKWYFVLKCTVGIRPPTPVPDEVARDGMLYGTYLPEHPTEEFRKFLIWEEQGLKDLLQSLSKQKTPAARARAGTMKKQLDENRAIQERISPEMR